MKIKKEYIFNSLILLLLVMFCSCTYVVAQEEDQQDNKYIWECPKCNKQITTNYCPDCGTGKPETNSENDYAKSSTYESKNFELSEEKLFEILTNWIDAEYSEVRPILISNGFTYQGKDPKWQGNVYVFTTTDYDFDITLFDTDEDWIIETVEAIFGANAEAYNTIYNSLVEEFGKPVINREIWLVGERARWLSSNMIEYQLCGDISTTQSKKKQNERATLAQIEAGKHSFQLRLCKRTTPLETDEPIITPAPTPRIESEISIASTKLSVSVSPQLFVVFKNNSNTPVDRIDFDVKCFDAYGNKIKGYGYYDYTSCFYDATTIKKGQQTRTDYRWYLTGFDGIKRVEIAITKYHMTDGTTIKIPEDQIEWQSYTFN